MIRIASTLALLVLAASFASAGESTAAVGAWQVLGADDAGRARSAVLYIEEKDGQLTGRWNTGGGSTELREVHYEGNRLSCWWYVDIQRTLIKLYFTATIDGDEFEGQLKEPHAIGKVHGERIGVKRAASPPPADDDGAKPAEAPDAP